VANLMIRIPEEDCTVFIATFKKQKETVRLGDWLQSNEWHESVCDCDMCMEQRNA
jgi:hypothetical protein